MMFPSTGALAGALFAGLSLASPAPFYLSNSRIGVPTDVDVTLDTRTLKPVSFDLDRFWNDEILFQGVSSPAIEGVQEAIQLGLRLPQAAVSGAVSVQLNHRFLHEPTLRVNLGGVKVYIELDLAASAGVAQSVEIVASPKLSLAVPGLAEVDIGAGFALDLVVAASAAVELTGGVYVTLPDNAFVEVNILTKEIVEANLEGLLAQSLPLAIGAAVDLSTEIDLSIGLRLRTEVSISAGVHLLGLDIGAGADVAIWISLFDYTTTIVATSSCPVALAEVFEFSAGVAIKVDVEVGEVLDLTLAPSVIVTLATLPVVKVCIPERGYGGSFGSNEGVLIGNDNTSIGGSEPSASVSNGSGVPTGGLGSVVPSGVSAVSTAASESLTQQPPSGTAVVTDGTFPTALPNSASGSWNNSNYPETSGGSGNLVTSTTTTTATYTITSCAASVPNCPASYTQKVVTSTVIVKTTVCPATATGTGYIPYPSAGASYVPTTSQAMPSPTGAPSTMTPCATPTTSTHTPPPNYPTPVPTVTISDTTTVCPATETGYRTATPSAPGYPGEVPATTTGYETTVPVPTGYPTQSESEVPVPTGYPTESESEIPVPTGYPTESEVPVPSGYPTQSQPEEVPVPTAYETETLVPVPTGGYEAVPPQVSAPPATGGVVYPTGTGAWVPPAVTPSAIVTAGASRKIAGGIAAAAVPILAALL